MHPVEAYIQTAQIKAAKFYRGIHQAYRIHDIQDLVQDLLLVALKAIEEFDPLRDCSLKTWVNLKMDYHIQEVKRKVATSPVRIEYVGDLHDLFLFVQRYRFYGTVFHCGEVAFIYDRLTQKQRDILDLKLQGYTYAEIAEKLGYSDHSGVIRQWGKIAALLNEEKSNKPVTN